MEGIEFTWDARKAVANKAKHGVSFEEAKSAFYDESARLVTDPDHSEQEDRYVLLGVSAKLRILLVCHAYRNGNTIRIISARKANKEEQRQYEGFKHA